MKRLLTLLFVASLFGGCGSGGGDTTSPEITPSTRADAPQPNVADESLRPPKPPSL
jgi:hypothetical protein